EGAAIGREAGGLLAGGLGILVPRQPLKRRGIVSLGPFWTFRVIVIPGQPLVARGPYRWLRDPNYVAVMGELAGVALMTRAVVSGPAATAGFALLLIKRVSVEERTLATASRRTNASN